MNFPKRLVYLSPVPWDSFAQRPHWFVQWFHVRSGGQVLWLDPYPTRLPSFKDIRRQDNSINRTKMNVPSPSWLTCVKVPALPIEPLPGSHFINHMLWRDSMAKAEVFLAQGKCALVAGKPSQMAISLMKRHPDVITVYDAMDNFPQFYFGLSRLSMMRMEKKIAAIASRIMASSTHLASRFVKTGKLHIAHNACDVASLPVVTARLIEKPVLGFVGTIAHWFDWPLVMDVAHNNPQVTIRLIGPVHSPPPCALPSNIEMLPACSHDDAIHALQNFSVGFIPFKKNRLTASIDSIKYYEYRAMGLPVLSTCFGEMALRKNESGIFLISDNASCMLEAALHYQPSVEETQEFRNKNSWDARFDASGLFS